MNKVLFRPTLKVLDEVRSKGNAHQARDLEQGCLIVGKNYLLLVYMKMKPCSSIQGPLGCLVRDPFGLGRLPFGLGVVNCVGNMLT